MGRINQLIPLKFQREKTADRGKNRFGRVSEKEEGKSQELKAESSSGRELKKKSVTAHTGILALGTFGIKTVAMTHKPFSCDSDSRVESTESALAMEQFLTYSGE